MYEVETKILDVSKDEIEQSLNILGAKKIQTTRLWVDWFRSKGILEGEDPWYLRVRKYSDGKVEVTWKGKSEILGAARKHKEINFLISDPQAAKNLFLELNLEAYAHQEKDRLSWEFMEWRFDLDQYPNMPAYLEIEGKDEAHILEAIKLLKLDKHRTSSLGETSVIRNIYGLDWNNMKFNE